MFKTNSALFAIINKSKLSREAFFYLLQPKSLVPFSNDYKKLLLITTALVETSDSIYLEFFWDSGQIACHYYKSYFSKPKCPGLLLGVERFSELGLIEKPLKRLQIEVIESLTYYNF